ncbi:hypothetical protein FB45DRAFT_1066419 [Roridomyces roridus]|uniref:BTB domain-containing protein n=1 Tax=Roridomyces roridus TaxID=1738132 RepID=A0AAD7F915_9AGAR|nr:hypothetical protein FB45DRAFT_1066419 [Roridomyces roridus]
MSAAHPPFTDASAPFCGQTATDSGNPPSDLILRSSNHVDFHVHKQILSFVSVFFAGMFAFPPGNAPPTEIQRDGKPVLSLPESDEVLYRLLRLAYPGRSRQQYSFTAADLDSVLARTRWQEHPHRLFAIGLIRKLPTLTQKAAVHTLRLPLSPIGLHFPELHLITGANLQNLYAFHRECGQDAARILRDTVIPRHVDDPHRPETLAHGEHGDPLIWWLFDGHSAECGPTVDSMDTVRPAGWFRAHIERLGPQVSAIPAATAVLARITAIEEDVALTIKACVPCAMYMESDLADVAELVARRIDKSHVYDDDDSEETVKKWAF